MLIKQSSLKNKNIVIESSLGIYSLDESDSSGKTELEMQLRIDVDKATEPALRSLKPIWIHKNKDGSWALAVGDKPVVWPENQPARKPL